MPRRKLSSEQISELIELYKNPQIKMDVLCETFKVSDDTIVRAMKREGVPLRVTIGFYNQENSNWKGGYSSHYAKNVAVRHLRKNKCVVCGYNVSTDVHHWDKDSKNNSSENLILLCPNHHREIHLGILKKDDIIQSRLK